MSVIINSIGIYTYFAKAKESLISVFSMSSSVTWGSLIHSLKIFSAFDKACSAAVYVSQVKVYKKQYFYPNKSFFQCQPVNIQIQ